MTPSDNEGNETSPIVLKSTKGINFSTPQKVRRLNALSTNPDTGRIAMPLMTSAETAKSDVQTEYQRYQTYTFKDGKPHTFSPNGIDGYPFDPTKKIPFGESHRAVWHVDFDGITLSLGAEIGGKSEQESHAHPQSPELVFAADETGVIHIDTPSGRETFKSPALLYFPPGSEHSIVFPGNHYTVDFKNIAFGDRKASPTHTNSTERIMNIFEQNGGNPVEIVDSRNTNLKARFIKQDSKLNLPAGVLNLVFPLTQDTSKISYNGTEASASFLQPHALYNKGVDYGRKPINLEGSTSDLFLVQCPINMIDSDVIKAFNY